MRDFADDRLIRGCLYCGGLNADTRDHVPSKSLLDAPYPENLPVVGCCSSCNQGFSKDEEYLSCLIEAAICGSTDPEKVLRKSVAGSLRNSPALRARIDAARQCPNGQDAYGVEQHRVTNVMLKLARGHAAFELSQPCRHSPDHFWCGLIDLMEPDIRERFDAPHEQQMFGEIGCRGIQRMLVTEIKLRSLETGEELLHRLLLNGWVDVQEGNYRYLAIDDAGGIVIRIVVREYLACEVGWRRGI